MLPVNVSFRHLERLTDDTGLLEHALGSVPRRQEGYATDDNARALWVCIEWLQLLPAEGESRSRRERILNLVDRYLAFLLWVQRPDGTFHNNIRYERLPEAETPSDDCLGRSLWACALAAVHFREMERRLPALEMFRKGLPRLKTAVYPRGWAYGLAACSLMFRANGNIDFSGEKDDAKVLQAEGLSILDLLEYRLISLYAEHSRPGWRWFEPLMTYGNGVLPWALFRAYPVTQREQALATGKETLEFLIEKMTDGQGRIRPVGNRGWCGPDHRSDWDQQPLDVMKLALASWEAYQVLQNPAYLEIVEKCRSWFFGENDLGLPLVNREEGSCYDGLTPHGVNLNQGAESTLSYLLTEALYLKAKQEVDVDDGNEREPHSFPCVSGV